jgi:hypothetical protein
MKNLYTALNFELAIHFESIEGMNSRKVLVLAVTDLIGDVKLIIIQTIHDSLRSNRIKDNHELVGISHLISSYIVVYTMILGINYSKSIIKLNSTNV